jgi:hypothetical protein
MREPVYKMLNSGSAIYTYNLVAELAPLAVYLANLIPKRRPLPVARRDCFLLGPLDGCGSGLSELEEASFFACIERHRTRNF